jgi:hypothetical protein
MPLRKKFSYIPFAKLHRQIDLFHASLAPFALFQLVLKDDAIMNSYNFLSAYAETDFLQKNFAHLAKAETILNYSKRELSENKV